ncbi:hypothetical protein BH11PLA2_BH11PLA2_41380 [soil metagenome]
MAFRPKLELLEGRETPSAASLYAIGGGYATTPRVKVFDTNTGAQLADFIAFEPTFGGGTSVTIGDVNADGFPEVIVGAGISGGPRVRIFDGRAFRPGSGFPAAPNNNTAAGTNIVFADFFAFETAQRGGVNVTSGQITGSVNAEVIVGAGSGGGPRVRIFDGAAIAARQRNYTPQLQGDVSADFFAFESSFRNGVFVSIPSGNFGNLVVSPGNGGAPRVRVLNSNQIAFQGVQYNTTRSTDVIADFFAGSSTLRGGAYVSTADFNFDTVPDVAVGSGPGVVGTVTVYSGAQISSQGQTFTGLLSPDVISKITVADSNYTNGVSVGTAGTNTSLSQGYLIYGYGGPMLNSEKLIRFDPLPGNAGVFNPTLIRQTTLNSTFTGVPSVSN